MTEAGLGIVLFSFYFLPSTSSTKLKVVALTNLSQKVSNYASRNSQLAAGARKENTSRPPPEPHSGALQSWLLFGANCSNRATMPLKRTAQLTLLTPRTIKSGVWGAGYQRSGPGSTPAQCSSQWNTDTLELGAEFPLCGGGTLEHSKPGNKQQSVYKWDPQRAS